VRNKNCVPPPMTKLGLIGVKPPLNKSKALQEEIIKGVSQFLLALNPTPILA